MMNGKQPSYPLKDRWSYLWLLLGSVLTLFSTGQWTIPLFTWIGSIFVLRFVRSQPVLRGYILAWLTNFFVVSIAWWNILGYGSSLPAFLVTMAISTLFIGALPYLLDRLLVPRLSGFATTLVYPLAVTALEFLTISANPMGSIGAQAYTQYNSQVLMQLVSVTGMWGLTFLVTWFAALVNFAWERSFSWSEIRRGVAIYAGVMLVVVAYGNIRLAFPQAQTGTLRVHGFIAADGHEVRAKLAEAKQQSRQSFRELSAEIQDLYIDGSYREAQRGAQLIVWPENAVWLASEDEAALIARGSQLAQDEGVYLALGYSVDYPDSPYENKLVILDPTGQVALEHLKFGGQALEGFNPGDGVLKTVETPFGTLSAIICWDTFFQKPVLQAGRNGTDILLTTSLEFRDIVPMHAQITTFRSIENGVSLVRVADNGISFAADPYGRTLASVDYYTTSERVMVAQVPAYHVTTIYAIIGDLFGWLAVAGLVAVTLVAVVQGRREKRAVAAQPEPETHPAS
ncbi:MAG: nitrilase-related carbon-nitrogen hydrolase [Anaerolineales bacterium]